jgi:protocatechuate 3,4-dioxygenase beta subunit
MERFNERKLEAAVVARLAKAKDPRFRKVMSSLVKHLHAFVREVELTEQEWLQAIQFLTATGQKCDDKRQEFILLSDLLGVSMLVDAINHRASSGETDSTVLGPFFAEGAPKLKPGGSIARDGSVDPTLVRGRVVDAKGRGVADAVVDVWQTGSDATYDVQRPGFQGMDMRGTLVSDADGRFSFRTVRPRSYPVPTDGPCGDMLRAMKHHARRPAHIHFMIAAPGYERLITHLFVQGDQYIESDAVFGVKQSLIVPFRKHGSKREADELNMPSPFYTVDFDFALKRAKAGAKARGVWAAKAAAE